MQAFSEQLIERRFLLHRALELLLLRDVPQSQRGKNGFAVRIPDRHQGPGGVEAGAVPAQVAALDLPHRFATRRLLEQRLQQTMVLRRRDDGDRLADRFACGPAEHPLGRGVPRQDGAVERATDDGGVRVLDDSRKHRLCRRAVLLAVPVGREPNPPPVGNEPTPSALQVRPRRLPGLLQSLVRFLGAAH